MGLESITLLAPLSSGTDLSVGSGSATKSRASVGTFKPGVFLQTAAINVMRFQNGAWLTEGASTNEARHNRDFTDAVWVKTNLTAAQDAIGLDGVSNAASTLTATSANGTCFQTVTKGSTQNTYSIDVRRKTGTGTIEITDDGGVGFTDITSSINSSTYTRFEITTTQANPEFGVRIVTSGDEVEVDYAQLEALGWATSRIETAGSSVTRAEDKLGYDSANWPTIDTTFTVAMTVTSRVDSSTDSTMIEVVGLGGVTDMIRVNFGNEFRARYAAKSVTDTTNNANAGTFRVIFTFNIAGDQKLYTNTILEDTETPTAAAGGAATEIRLGRQDTAVRNFFGEISNLRIYADELTQEEIDDELKGGLALTFDLTSDLTFDLTSDLTG